MVLVHRAEAAVNEMAGLRGSRFEFVMQLSLEAPGQDAQLWYIPGHLIRGFIN